MNTTTPTTEKDNLTVSHSSKIRFIKLMVIGFIIAAGFGSCVVYGHPYHHHYYRSW